ncbi:cysteine desulfurase [Candidatus Woesearchaeota archaeon]|nr:cysteine desulfurase [Candidatus Woesearchaeota archaeon]
MKRIYMDNGATTKVAPEVAKVMKKYFSDSYGNSSSLHKLGRDANKKIEEARKIIADSINAEPNEIIFTSGGTESNNLTLKGIAFANEKGSHIIVTKVEHDCVLNSAKWLEKQGYKITYLNVDTDGFVNEKDLEKSINEKTILVSIIHGNNEVGTIQNLEKLGKICRKRNVLFHTDACQSYTKTEIDVKKQNLDLVTLNSHKIHGPKGVGALFIRKGINITPWQHGGGHEFNLRSGTLNVPGIIGFSEAVKIANKKDIEHMIKLREKIIEGVFDKISDVKLNGSKKERLCNNINFTFFGIEGEGIVGYLDEKGICASTGSACSSNSLEPSHVLQAIGFERKDCNSSLRLTLSRYNTEKEVDYLLKVLPEIIEKLRRFTPYKNV